MLQAPAMQQFQIICYAPSPSNAISLYSKSPELNQPKITNQALGHPNNSKFTPTL
jgi:hypothetical protein